MDEREKANKKNQNDKSTKQNKKENIKKDLKLQEHERL